MYARALGMLKDKGQNAGATTAGGFVYCALATDKHDHPSPPGPTTVAATRRLQCQTPPRNKPRGVAKMDYVAPCRSNYGILKRPTHKVGILR